MPELKSTRDLVGAFARRGTLRAGSLIITVFGDSISQHGNCVWLGSLIDALAPFGLNARQIRTAVFRLAQEDWLATRQIGRRSYYSFTESGMRHYEKAARRIYAARRPRWDETWTLVIPVLADNAQRETLRKELRWLGFGSIAPGVLAHPAPDRQSLDETVQELEVGDRVLIMQARAAAVAPAAALQRLVQEGWDLDDLSRRYRRFLAVFRPVGRALERARRPDPRQCFELRTLLIHEYRRILLHDSDLPDELLPADWPRRDAADLSADLYRQVQTGAAQFLQQHMEAPGGSLPPPAPASRHRFK
jgi:phenylacetic acid degradation operon negative regulatory protein